MVVYIKKEKIIGKLLNLEIIGIDLPFYKYDFKCDKDTHWDTVYSSLKKMNTPYIEIQTKLIETGFNIKLFDTTYYPWKQFKNNYS